MSYKHISSFQRNELSVLLRTKTKQKKIAKILKNTEPLFGVKDGETGMINTALEWPRRKQSSEE